jgi:peptidoglycan/LPS O-acetylase OafA/YrhL
MTMSAGYRADIDGLRALAVTIVILYHAGIAAFEGGFVGVDVFFVISGFVIARSVTAELEAERFTVAGFWERRIRRLYPALYAMVFVALVAGWFIQMPGDFKRLGESVVATSTFLSNAYFMKDAGYFGVPARLKPLLHTWSLSVEEQFYLLLPIAVSLAPRLPKRLAPRRLLFGAMLASFALACGLTPVERLAAFFLLPSRAWELLVGVLLALEFARVRVPERAREPLGLVGLALVLVPTVTYTEQTPFPGLAALPPVAGAALLVVAGEGAPNRLGKLLASRAATYVGRLSYPLYLWHFPLFGFASYLSIEPLPLSVRAALVAATFVLAAATYHLVEAPFRERRIAATRRAIVTFGVVLASLSIVLGLAIFRARGVEGRLSPERRAIVRGAQDSRRVPECMGGEPTELLERCRFGAPTGDGVLVWGDSHAEAWLPGLHEAASSAGVALAFAGHHGCPIEAFLAEPDLAERSCQRFGRAMRSAVLASPVRRVWLASRWSSLATHDGARLDPTLEARATQASARLREVVTTLVDAGKEVTLVGPVPSANASVPWTRYVQSLGFSEAFELRRATAAFREETAFTKRVFESLSGSAVRVVWPADVLCQDALCEVVADGRALYVDDSHLSVTGAQLVASRMRFFERK